MTMKMTDWLVGSTRDPAISQSFETVDGAEQIDHSDELIDELGRRLISAKSSRSYLEKYADRFDWEFLGQRLSAGPKTLRRGDFGEVVAMAWLEDYAGLEIPVKKLRFQLRPGQSLPGTDAVGFAVSEGKVERVHFLESKLRTTAAFLGSVGIEAYQQLESDRLHAFLEILQFVHEWLYNFDHELLEPVSVFLEDHDDQEDDAHEVALLVDQNCWNEIVLSNLDQAAGGLPNCTVHVLLVDDLAQLVDEAVARIGVELIKDEDAQ